MCFNYMKMERMTLLKMNRTQCARHISNGCTLSLFLEEGTTNDASHLRHSGIQPLLSSHSYSKHFTLDTWSCCLYIPFKYNYIWKLQTNFKKTLLENVWMRFKSLPIKWCVLMLHSQQYYQSRSQ